MERAAVIGIGQTKHEAKRTDVSIAGLVREAARRRSTTPSSTGATSTPS